MKAGYVISGVIMITLGSVLAVLATVSGLILGIYNVGNSATTGSGSVSASTLALTSFIQNTFYLSFLVAVIFYVTGALFMWQGFKPPAVAQQSVAVQTQQPSVVAICPSCKSRVSVDSKFCPVCGSNLGPKT